MATAPPDPLTPTPEFQARVVRGRELAERGEFEAAEAAFLALLAQARGSHAGDHARALASLATLYGRAGRFLEAHALASRLAGLARAHGAAADGTLAFALAKVCGSLSQLHQVGPLREALAELRRVLDRHAAPLPNLELEYHVAAAARATTTGELASARAHVEAYRRALHASGAPAEVYRWALTMAEGRLLVREGRAEEALRVLAGLGAGTTVPAFAPLHGFVLEVEVHVALRRRPAALEAAGRALDVLASIDRAPYLAAGVVHQGNLLAQALEACGEDALARRAYDLMAAAVLVNLRQVEACVRLLPELGLADDESRATLGRFRKQFLREQRTLLGRVAALLSRGPGFEARALLTLPGREAFVPVCAWCESVRSASGAWLPLGHYVPREGPFELTHGICPGCAVRLGGPVAGDPGGGGPTARCAGAARGGTG